MTTQEIAQKLKEVAPDAVILSQEEGCGLVVKIVETVMLVSPQGVLELVDSDRARMLAKAIGIPTIKEYVEQNA